MMEDIAEQSEETVLHACISHARRSQTGWPGSSAAAFSRPVGVQPIGMSLDLPSVG